MLLVSDFVQLCSTRLANINNMTGVLYEAGTAYPPRAPEFTPGKKKKIKTRKNKHTKNKQKNKQTSKAKQKTNKLTNKQKQNKKQRSI